MSGDLQLTFLDPKTVTDTQIAEVTHTVCKAFKDYNVSINAASEVIEEEFGDPKIGPLVVSGICNSLDGVAATNGDGQIVSVTFVDVHAKGSKVALLGPVASLAPGAGKKTVVAACAHVETLGFSTLILMQVASNSRAFSLYAKLGFEAKHTCQYIGGFLPPSESSSPATDTDGLSLMAMTAQDVPECVELFRRAHGADSGWDRQPDITGLLAAGYPFDMLVARDAAGKMVGYSTGFFIVGHQVSVSQDVFCAMYTEASRLHQERGLPCPRFHCPLEYPGLLSWALEQRLTVYRAVIIMARGTYEHAWPGCGLVVTPSGMGW